ncbi:hypothetical protein LPA44_15450 [Halobacterium sp. KA-4]|jgi:hypothetical protein|uniref:hypothetical protein n=1 Tax=Halobacteriales TaxID=2235 RepID=UPI001E3C60FC|nr:MULTISPECIES: hypothetical protein [Halobacteriales]MCD2201269.1 hypothetical protein [Halobacterium sp. KA-4]
MSFSGNWHTLLEAAEELSPEATLITPLSHTQFRITDIQEHRIIIEILDSDDSQPLQRDQFETLYRRVQDASGGFELDRLPPDAEPYAAVLTLHPQFEIDEDAGILVETDAPTATQVIGEGPTETDDRTEPDVGVYADALLLIDELERHDLTSMDTLDTETLIDLYTLLSDVQRGANDLRKDIADTLLDRVHHDQPVHAQYGSVQRTSRRSKSLKDETEVLAALEDAGIDRDRVLGVDPDKVDDALDVTDLHEQDVYDIDERAYVRKADVNEDVKETRLQGLKDRLAATDSEEADVLRSEIEDLEDRIDELTSFRTGSEVQ